MEKQKVSTPSELSKIMIERIGSGGFYTRRSIQKILKEHGVSASLDLISKALAILSKEKCARYEVATKFWIFLKPNEKEECKPKEEQFLYFKEEYVESIVKKLYDTVSEKLETKASELAIESVQACIDDAFTKLTLDHTEKIILNEIRVNFRSQLNQHIKDVVSHIVSEYINSSKKQIMTSVKKELEIRDMTIQDMQNAIEELYSKFNF